jgi:hypothetical protein
MPLVLCYLPYVPIFPCAIKRAESGGWLSWALGLNVRFSFVGFTMKDLFPAETFA